MKINVANLSNPHFDYLFFRPEYSNFVLKGGRASTKSSAISIKIVTDFLADKMANVAVFRKVGNTLAGSVYEQIKWAIYMLGFENRFRYIRSPLKIIDRVLYSPRG